MATGKGIGNNKIALNAYSLSGDDLPKKVESQSIATTDADGNYSFIFDAYTTKNIKKEVSYGVEMVNDKYYTITQLSDVISRKIVNHIDLTKYYNSNLVPSQHVDELGENNEIDLEVVLTGKFFFQFFNSTESDSLSLYCINNVIDYILIENVTDPVAMNSQIQSYYFLLLTGENKLRKTIYKNGQISIIDTTIYVEPKDYHINFHY